MGIFDFLRPKRPPRPPGGKDIEKLTSEELVVWLQKQPRWRELGTGLLTALARRLQGEPFAAFWGACEATGLDLGKGASVTTDPENDMSVLASMLHLRGSAVLESIRLKNPGPERLRQQACIACMCYESAARLFPDGLHHYCAIAAAEGMSYGDYGRVREFAVSAAIRSRQGGGPSSGFTRQALRDAVKTADASPDPQRLSVLAESLRAAAGVQAAPPSAPKPDTPSPRDVKDMPEAELDAKLAELQELEGAKKSTAIPPQPAENVTKNPGDNAIVVVRDLLMECARGHTRLYEKACRDSVNAAELLKREKAPRETEAERSGSPDKAAFFEVVAYYLFLLDYALYRNRQKKEVRYRVRFSCQDAAVRLFSDLGSAAELHHAIELRVDAYAEWWKSSKLGDLILLGSYYLQDVGDLPFHLLVRNLDHSYGAHAISVSPVETPPRFYDMSRGFSGALAFILRMQTAYLVFECLFIEVLRAFLEGTDDFTALSPKDLERRSKVGVGWHKEFLPQAKARGSSGDIVKGFLLPAHLTRPSASPRIR